MATDKKELWVGWSHAAVRGYKMPEEVDNAEELAEDMADVAAGFADAMLEEYEERFDGKKITRRRKSDDEDEE